MQHLSYYRMLTDDYRGCRHGVFSWKMRILNEICTLFVYSLAPENSETVAPFIPAFVVQIFSLLLDAYPKASFGCWNSERRFENPRNDASKNILYSIEKKLSEILGKYVRIDQRTCKNHSVAFTSIGMIKSFYSLSFVNIGLEMLTKETALAGAVREAMTVFKPDCRKNFKYYLMDGSVYLLAYCFFFFAASFYRDLNLSRPHSMVRHVISTLAATLSFGLFRSFWSYYATATAYELDDDATKHVNPLHLAEFLLRLCITSKRFIFRHPIFPMFTDIYSDIGRRIQRLVKLSHMLKN